MHLVLYAALLAHAQEPPVDPPADVPSVTADDLAALAARVAALEAELKAREEEDLLRDAEAALAAAPPPAAPSVAPSLFPLNPGITAFGDLVGQVGVVDGAVMPGSTMYLRSLELDVRAQVDPFAKAAAVIAFEQEAPPLDGSEPGGEFEVGPEEVYADLVALPWHLSARVGKFKQPFGLANRTHPHDLPWVDPPPALELLGEEGYNDVGGTLSFVQHAGPLGITLTAGALSGQPFEPAPNAGLAGLGRAEVFAGLGSVDVGVGGSAVRHLSRGDQVLGADLSVRWRPSSRRSVVVLGELFHDMDAVAGYGALQVQPLRQVYVGFREDAGPDGLRHNAYLSYYTTEFLRLRAGAGLTPETGQVDALAQMTFVWGSHPVEPWWVNK